MQGTHGRQLTTIRTANQRGRWTGGRRSGFTLTELLIVIAIIGVLAALITGAAVNALRNARRARILLEIKNISAALESFKTDLGSYPPSGMHDNSTPAVQQISSDMVRTAQRAFPRINAAELSVFRALAGDLSAPTVVTSDPLEGGLSASESLFFWLGGFSSDPQFPLTGPGGPAFIADDVEVFENRQFRYEFNPTQLGPRTEGDLDYSLVRFIEYTPSMNGDTRPRRINLWRYGSDGSEKPYVYFDASRYRPGQYDMPAFDPTAFPDEPEIYAIKQYRTGATGAAGLAKNLMFVNQRKFQILHPGLDDVWGDFSPLGVYPKVMDADADGIVTFPEGPFLGETGDTLTNFADGELQEQQEE